MATISTQKKLIKIFCFTLMFIIPMFSAVNCSARIPPAQCFLGNLTTGTPLNEALRIYGNPVRKEVIGSIQKYIYGNGSFWFNVKDGIVLDICSESNNGIYTADGVSVGMSIQAMYNAYGRPDGSWQNGNTKIYSYVEDTGRVSSTELAFSVVNNKIVKIYLNCEV